jgi:hypothetical protein
MFYGKIGDMEKKKNLPNGAYLSKRYVSLRNGWSYSISVLGSTLAPKPEIPANMV